MPPRGRSQQLPCPQLNDPDWSGIQPVDDADDRAGSFAVLSYDELSFADFLRSRGAANEAVELIRRTTCFGEMLERGSALSVLINCFAILHQAGPAQMAPGGNDQLPRAVAPYATSSAPLSCPPLVTEHLAAQRAALSIRRTATRRPPRHLGLAGASTPA